MNQMPDATFVSEGTVSNGSIVFNSQTHFSGSHDGSLSLNGPHLLTIDHESKVKGKVQGSTIVIFGKVEGQIIASVEVKLMPSAEFTGEILSPSLSISPGAKVNIKKFDQRKSV